MCTSFAVYGKERAIYGMNFDTNEIDLKLTISSYKDFNVFYFSALMEGVYRDIAAINSRGLFFCTQAVEYRPGIESSCDKNDWEAFKIFDDTLRISKNVSDFLSAINDRVISFPRNPLYPDLGLHTLVADLSKDSLILEEGIDSNTLCRIKDKFIVMTNFPNGDFIGTSYNEVSGRGSDRYIYAYEHIERNLHKFSVDDAFDILKETRQDDTLCTIVYEPLKNEVYISFKADLNRKWKISIIDKTVQSLDGILNNEIIHFKDGEMLAKDLTNLYK